MATILPGVARTRPFTASSCELLAPVILDSGEQARVVTVPFPQRPNVGDRFELDGRTWEVTRAKDFLRGLVARPVQVGTCVH
jgi:hypothetical protein